MLIPPRVSVPVVKYEQTKYNLDDLKKKFLIKKREKPAHSDVKPQQSKEQPKTTRKKHLSKYNKAKIKNKNFKKKLEEKKLWLSGERD